MTMYNTPSLVSNSLTWERIRTLDLGIDLGFLDNELNVSFDWYQRKTLDMLAPGVTLPTCWEQLSLIQMPELSGRAAGNLT